MGLSESVGVAGELTQQDKLFKLAEHLHDALALADSLGLSALGIQLSEAVNECQRAIGEEMRRENRS